jgi:protein-S-isoprenylcysteine O-methyltransferase Ste14
MYGSLLFLALGAVLKQITFVTTVILFAIFILLLITAKVEEKENVLNFGKEYEKYIKKTKMYIPFII